MDPHPLVFENVSRWFGKVQALQNFSLTLCRGHIYGLVGENGAGKTTALSLAVGLMRPSTGKVRLFGHDPEREPHRAKAGLGFLPDRPHVPPRLSGREYLRFVAALWGKDPQRADREAQDLIRRFDLDRVYDARTETYSHGMRQKLVLASQLAHGPELFLLDEPMVGLDVRSSRELRQLLRDLARNGSSVLISSHSLSLVERLCDRVGVLRRGRMVFEGTVEEIVDNVFDLGPDHAQALVP